MDYGRKPDRERWKLTQAIALLLQLGLTVAAIMVGTVLLGIFLDNRLGTEWVFTAAMGVLGAASGFYALYKMAMRSSR